MQHKVFEIKYKEVWGIFGIGPSTFFHIHCLFSLKFQLPCVLKIVYGDKRQMTLNVKLSKTKHFHSLHAKLNAISVFS